MPDTHIGVQPPLEFIPPKFDPKVLWVVQRLLPFAMRQRTAIRDIEVKHIEVLADLYRQFQAGKIRLLLAFRHPSADDPFCLCHMLWKLLPAAAQKQGIPFQQPTHAHFIYDRGIPLWAGDWVNWLYPRLGGTPIHRGKLDLTGLRSARDLFANGPFPMMAAPEGATNGHSEIVSPLEPGISQLSFWCIEDLAKAGRTEQVVILPIGLQYCYINPPWTALRQILTELEADTGLALEYPDVANDASEATLYKRLYRLGEYLLSVMENYYVRFYHKTLPAVNNSNVAKSAETLPLISAEVFAVRLNALLDAALQVAEEFFGFMPKGSLIDRCRRLEQASWDYVYREDLNLGTIAPLERGLADRLAEEADLRVWHMRLVESFVAVTGKYVQEKATAERFAETTLLIWDMVCRIKGNSPFNRPKLGAQRGIITVGEPILVSERWESYKGGRKNAKQAVETLTRDLQTALEAMI